MHLKILFALVLFTLGSLTTSTTKPKPTPASSPEQTLDRILPEVNFDQVPLREALDFLARQSGLKFDIDWKSIEAAGCEPQSPITLRMRDVKFAKVLSVVLDLAGENIHLDFKPTNNALVISTADKVASQTTTVIYDIRNLLKGADDPNEEAGNIINIIQQNIDCGTWFVDGGLIGKIKQRSSRLIITQNYKAHRRIVSLLNSLNAPPMYPKRDPATQKTIESLKSSIKPLFVDNVPLSDVIDYLRVISGQNILVNWRTLQIAGIDKNASLSLQLKAPTLKTALDAILDKVSPQKTLGYDYNEGVINISTRGELSYENTITLVYPIRDLIEQSPRLAEEYIVRHILSNISHDSWRDGSGTVGSIQSLGGRLIITQTNSAHDQIVEFLKDLRQRPPSRRFPSPGGGG